MKIQTTIHLDQTTKKEAQKILIDSGKSLSETIENYLEKFIEGNKDESQ